MSEKIKISIGGNKDSCELIKKILAKESNLEIVDFNRFDKSYPLYWIFGRGPSLLKNIRLWVMKKPLIIVHWIGTDVLIERDIQQNKQGLKRIYYFLWDILIDRKIKSGNLVNFAVTPLLVDELSELNVNSICVPLTTINTELLGEVRPDVKKDIDFMSYVISDRLEFYGEDKIIALAKKWPNYNFFIIYPDLDTIPLEYSQKVPPNLVLSPKMDHSKMSEVYLRSKFFIRYVQHDGLSLSVLEALYFKLQVLWIYDFPHTIKIDNQKTLFDNIPHLISSWCPNEEGHKFVIENYSVDSWKKQFITIVQFFINNKNSGSSQLIPPTLK
jgi:hypothetical protein